MKKEIPAPIISVLSTYISELETHPTLDNLFFHADAPGDPPEGSKLIKTQEWLRRINKECNEPLKVLGRLIEGYMEVIDQDLEDACLYGEQRTHPKKIEFKDKLTSILDRSNLSYIKGGLISDGSSVQSKTLAELIKGRDIRSIEIEFDRALNNVNSDPREAVSAACNILESIFKVYIADENLSQPQKQDLQNVWKVVRANLGFNPSSVEDDDLKKILSGILSVVDGIGAFRTHASSAHGQGRKLYNLKPRHARLAINSAHTLAVFVLESWDERRNK